MPRMVLDPISENYFYYLKQEHLRRNGCSHSPCVPVQSLPVCRRNCDPWLSSFSAETKIGSGERSCRPFSLSFWHLLPVPLGEMNIACPGHPRGPIQGRCVHLASKGSFPAPGLCHRKRDRPGKPSLPQPGFPGGLSTHGPLGWMSANKRESE